MCVRSGGGCGMLSPPCGDGRLSGVWRAGSERSSPARSPLPLPLELFPAKGSTRAFLSPGREWCSRGLKLGCRRARCETPRVRGLTGGCSPGQLWLSIPAEMLSSSPRASAHFPPCRASDFTPGTCEVAQGSKRGAQAGPRGGLQHPAPLRWDTAAPCCVECPGSGAVLESLQVLFLPSVTSG